MPVIICAENELTRSSLDFLEYYKPYCDFQAIAKTIPRNAEDYPKFSYSFENTKLALFTFRFLLRAHKQRSARLQQDDLKLLDDFITNDEHDPLDKESAQKYKHAVEDAFFYEPFNYFLMD